MIFIALAGVALSGCATGISGEADFITGTSARVAGQVVSDTGGQVEYWAEYGPTTAYGSETAHETVELQANGSSVVFRNIEGLARSTTYHYRLCARDGDQPGGPGCGEDKRFTTGEVACGDVITADFTLSADLDCTNRPDAPNALIVGAHGVTLDLAGHPVRANAAAVDNSGGYDDVTVRNGTLESRAVSVVLENASRNRLLDVLASGGVTMAGGEDNVIRDSTMSGGSEGLRVTGSERLVVVGSVAGGTEEIVLLADFARVRGNRLTASLNSGLTVRGSGNRIRDNDASGAWAGIAVEAGQGNVVAGNRANNSFSSFPSPGDPAIPFEDGIFVAQGASGTVLRSNVANRNGGDGIQLLSASTRLRNNTANENRLFGIDAVLGVVDLGGNTAAGNGAAAQCRNVACP